MERLTVEVQTNAPIDINGSLDVLGRTTIDGKISPREDAEVLEGNDVGVVVEPISVSTVACRALGLAVPDDETAEEVKGTEVNTTVELEEGLKVVVESGSVLGTDAGIWTGQNDQTCLP